MKHIKLFLIAAAIASLSLFTACKSTSGGSGSGSSSSSSSSTSTRTIASPDFFKSYLDGDRIYLVGTPEAAAKYESGGGVPIAKTFIDQVPGGKTLVVQAGKDGDALQNRLIAEFTRQTGIAIEQ